MVIDRKEPKSFCFKGSEFRTQCGWFLSIWIKKVSYIQLMTFDDASLVELMHFVLIPICQITYP